jgi:AcrR family transcriptional regulator
MSQSESIGARLVAAQGNRRNTREQIYDAALRLFATQGYRGTTLRQIAAEVGIEAASIYSHTESKQQLFFDLLMFSQEEVEQYLSDCLSLADEHPAAQLYAATYSHVAYHCRTPLQVAVIDRSFDELSPEQKEFRAKKVRAYGQVFEDILAAGIERGLFRPVDIRVTTFGIIALGTRTSRWYRAGGRYSPEEVGEQYADQALRAVGRKNVLSRLGDETLTFQEAARLFRPARGRQTARPARPLLPRAGERP